MDLIADDEQDRPTVPHLRTKIPRFDRDTELFFSDVPTLPEFAVQPIPVLEVEAWWAEERRRSLVGVVASAMALAVGLLALAVFLGPLV